MSAPAQTPRLAPTVKAVLAALDALEGGRHETQTHPLIRALECPTTAQASRELANALDRCATRRGRTAALLDPIGAPPGVLPPPV